MTVKYGKSCSYSENLGYSKSPLLKLRVVVESFKDFDQPTVKWQSFKVLAKLHGNALLFTNIFQYHKF